MMSIGVEVSNNTTAQGQCTITLRKWNAAYFDRDEKQICLPPVGKLEIWVRDAEIIMRHSKTRSYASKLPHLPPVFALVAA